ncbi:MAG: phosphoribosyltransferase [Candidatus Bathyarchaeia archaeon]
MAEQEYLILEWEDIYRMCIELSKRIKEDDFKPDVIVGVARGGWIPARILSDLLENTNLANIKAEFYEDVAKTGKKPRITQPVSTDVRGLKVLVVDDVSDTGLSLSEVRKSLVQEGAGEIKIATLHYKPHSVLKPEYYVDETSAWIVYPHERYEFIKSTIRKMRNLNLTEVKEWFKKIGFKAPYTEQLIEEAWKTIKV